ncbi:MAG: tagatose 1,6-diphosphate aldolase [Anaerolineales bacterium]
MSPSLTLGKIRGLQEIANDHGLFTITALDHRGSLRRALQPDDPKSVGYERMQDYKMKLLKHLAPASSAILIDPIYGASAGLAKGMIGGDQGFLVSLEATGYDDVEGDRVTSSADGWGVDKIKRMGASAVKILLYYNPGSSTAEEQEDYLKQAVEDCRKHDIPLLVEPMTYHIADGPKKGTLEFAKRKPEMVIETARRLCPLGIDVLKAEFPDDPDHEDDESVMAQHCRELNDAAGVPWVLLSAGVGYDKFKLQTKIACENGASGFLAGRAIWQEAPGLPEDEQDDFLASTSVQRLNELTKIANSSGRRWTDIYDDELKAADIAEGWQERY